MPIPIEGSPDDFLNRANLGDKFAEFTTANHGFKVKIKATEISFLKPFPLPSSKHLYPTAQCMVVLADQYYFIRERCVPDAQERINKIRKSQANLSYSRPGGIGVLDEFGLKAGAQSRSPIWPLFWRNFSNGLEGVER